MKLLLLCFSWVGVISGAEAAILRPLYNNPTGLDFLVASWKSKAAQTATHAQPPTSLKWSYVDVLGGGGQSVRAVLLPGPTACESSDWADSEDGPAMSCPPAWCWSAYSFQRVLRNLGAVPAAAKVNACCSPPRQEYSRTRACVGVFLKIWYDCHSRASSLTGRTLWLCLPKPSLRKNEYAGERSWDSYGVWRQVKEHKFLSSSVLGGHWPRECWIQMGSLWRPGYLVSCWFSTHWSFSRKVPLGTLVCGRLLRPFLTVWNLVFVFLRMPRIWLFCYILFPALSCYHFDILDRACFNSLLPITYLTHNSKHFYPW